MDQFCEIFKLPHFSFPLGRLVVNWKNQAEGMKALAMQRAQEAKMVDLKAQKKSSFAGEAGKMFPNNLTTMGSPL